MTGVTSTGRDPTADPKREFLTRVLLWPDGGEAFGFASVHWTIKAENFEKPVWTGRACRSLKEAVNAVDFALKGANTRDIYFCMSTQRQAHEQISPKTGYRYFKPIRSRENVVALKSLYIDIDAKGEDKNSYATVEDAKLGLAKFLNDTGMPQPTIVVSSGGGLHVYFCLDRPLAVSEWQPLADALAEATKQHGLRCDAQVTVDAARVLRVPGSWNCKTDPKRPVRIDGAVLDHDYSVEQIAQVLQLYMGATSSRAHSDLDPALFPPRAPIAEPSDLSAGIEKTGFPPVDLDVVARECGFLREAVTSRGYAYSNPLWNLTTLIATFTTGGRADAHRMANKHPGYSQQSTDNLFDRKEREKAQKDLGWPSCKAISGSGSTHCSSCVHFAAGKSPLHLASFSSPAASPAVNLWV